MRNRVSVWAGRAAERSKPRVLLHLPRGDYRPGWLSIRLHSKSPSHFLRCARCDLLTRPAGAPRDFLGRWTCNYPGHVWADYLPAPVASRLSIAGMMTDGKTDRQNFRLAFFVSSSGSLQFRQLLFLWTLLFLELVVATESP